MPRRVSLRTAAAVLGLALASLAPSPVVRADDAPAAEAPSPRLSALELQIRCLDRHLTALRHARTELAAGRAEPVPEDDVAKKAADADRRALEEVRRYENARGKAGGALSKAEDAKDDAKIAEARGEIDRIDTDFVAAMKKIEEGRPQRNAGRGDKRSDGGADHGKGQPGMKDMGD